MNSNLSKIKPKLRTQGNVTGNFGRNKVKSGSSLMNLGLTLTEKVSIPSRRSYIEKMIYIYRNHTDQKMVDFAYSELHRLNCFQETRLEELSEDY
jgi:hypothetical protein